MLSNRLALIADMVPKCGVMADIGTDHGYLPIDLVISGKVEKAYAMDINEGPLKKANQNIVASDVSEQVVTVLSNGLEKLPEQVEVVVIAGMGGMLIGKILESHKDKLRHLQSLVLSPHLDEVEMRQKVHELGWAINKEVMVKDNDKYYTVMSCSQGSETYTPLEYRYGKVLMLNRDPVWQEYLAAKVKKLEIILMGLKTQNTENAAKRLGEIFREIQEIKEVVTYET